VPEFRQKIRGIMPEFWRNSVEFPDSQYRVPEDIFSRILLEFGTDMIFQKKTTQMTPKFLDHLIFQISK
jgi:hypothetical protein